MTKLPLALYLMKRLDRTKVGVPCNKEYDVVYNHIVPA
jgi:hypothetical protein